MALVLILTEERFREDLEGLAEGCGFSVGRFSAEPVEVARKVVSARRGDPDLVLVVSETHNPTWGRLLDDQNVRYWLLQVGEPQGPALLRPTRLPHRQLPGLGRDARAYLSQLLDDWRDRPMMRIDCFTFAFRDGLPAEADWVLDTRFLDSPYWIPGMRERSGLDPVVRDHVMSDPAARRLIDGFLLILLDLVGLYLAQQRSVLRVAVGCTGGQHRSVAVAAELADRINGSGRATARHLESPPRHLPTELG